MLAILRAGAWDKRTVPVALCLRDLIARVQLVIAALLGHQLFVVAALDDAALLHDHDGVGILNGRQPVRDDKYRAAFHQLVHALLDQGLRTRVHAARRLVQDHDRGIGHRAARDGQQLALAL